MMSAGRFPFPIPFGWYCVAQPDEIDDGQARALFAFGRHLVAWRDGSGELRLHDAFCPHLGAHLGHGGTVVDGCIECPFHGWRFDGDGGNVAIPYSDRTNAKARLRGFPVVERNGVAMTWYHPDASVAPMWEVPEFPELAGDDSWTVVRTSSYEVESALQEMAENAVDTAHFRYVHNTATVPQLDSYEPSFPVSAMRSSQQFPTPRGVVDGRIDSTSYGPGISHVYFSGFVDLVNVAFATPIDADRSAVRFHFAVRTDGEADKALRVGAAFADEVHRQFLEDTPVWEHKAHLVRPALADTDGPFMKFRRWFAQFYAEGLAPSDERTVYPPPWWPDRVDESPAKATASARLGR
jgi:phenylpropionate dioxygenase-like ring-hydroxylating dioxygenase large terminal subunit